MNYNKKTGSAKKKDNSPPSTPATLGGRDPTRFLNFRLDILSNEGMKSVDVIYRREVGLDVRHLRVLRLVGFKPGITFSQLAEETRLERGLTSRIVTALTGQGLIERTAHDTDARQFHLHLTPRGEAVRDQADTLANRLEALLLSPLTGDERASLLSSLDKLTAWVRQGGGLEAFSGQENPEG